ncbi:sterol desaturase family protein [Mucilaginibacter auburnensis]|uniref:Fatty acid hydroxylase family protein n=1 Tax=Mucilaginibacter auburnensis TaxID=1457233 RepID=A0A2H9VMK9_9SPHI|nr:sterol desaturase family protein [Mucilaginibacter auburnensis]PJJ79570.1 fatty acid hydroxylase family protein [Mucilaginibacter auburnensis]
MLNFLSEQSSFTLLMIFLAENFIVTGIALFAGWLTIKLCKHPVKPASYKEILTCIVTNCINTLITFTGFKLWQHGVIQFDFDLSWWLIFDTILLFLAMDLAMYIFHLAIHRSVAYKYIHRFHHIYHDPIPIDLFVLHPLETVSFGLLWLIVIYVYTFNFWAVILYLTLNVVFGIAGHLGFEPLPYKFRNSAWLKYIGTPTFHHDHHTDVNYNFGFYTNLWDRLFHTYKER